MPEVAEDVAAPADPTMPASRSWVGQGGGEGWFVGPAYLAVDVMLDPVVDPSLEADDLLEAIALAASEIEAVMTAADPLSAGVLEFQAAMLRDTELAQPALRRIAAGDGAALAWAAAMDDYVAAFQDAGDGRGARNMDLVDIRNRVLATLCGVPRNSFPAGSVFVGEDMEPSAFLEHDWSEGGAIALSGGSLASHVSMLAGSRGIPMVCGLGDFSIKLGQTALVDGSDGRVVTDPRDTDLGLARRNAGRAADGRFRAATGAISLSANINQLGDLELFDPSVCAGIGLVRTEFLFGAQGPFAEEELQLSIYRQIAARFPGPTWIRLFDLGGDKPLPATGKISRNPLLGQRGVRFLLAQPNLLRTQARALLRTAAEFDIGVTIPMVTVPEEIEAVRAIFLEETAGLDRAGVAHAMPEIGMMVEVPAAALMLERFTNADFFSIGTNDLLQYLTAAARDDGGMHDLQQKALPALAKLTSACVTAADQMGKRLSVCGDLAGDPAGVAMLSAAGVRRLSIGPAQFPRIVTLLAESARS